jgi:hypothetical protein
VAEFWSQFNDHFFFLHKLQKVTKKKMLFFSCYNEWERFGWGLSRDTEGGGLKD